jgi:hypothetical protein
MKSLSKKTGKGKRNFSYALKGKKKFGLQNLRKSGLCCCFRFSFFVFEGVEARHNEQRDSLQHWQKEQSGHGYFFFCLLFSILYFNTSASFMPVRV